MTCCNHAIIYFFVYFCRNGLKSFGAVKTGKKVNLRKVDEVHHKKVDPKAPTSKLPIPFTSLILKKRDVADLAAVVERRYDRWGPGSH